MKKYKTGISSNWSYYFAKAILTPKKDIKKISFKDASKPRGDHISRQLSKSEYIGICKTLTAYVEKHKQMPNTTSYKKYNLHQHLLTEFLSRILVYYDKHNAMPKTANINSKCFTKPTEYSNEVYDYFVKKTGKKPKTLDEVLSYVANYFKYEYYYDDKKSNKQVMDSKAGNCTDLLQWLINMVKALGYEAKCIHVQCKSSGGGHVFGKFKHKKHTENSWVIRDIACVASNGNIKCVWCSDGYKLGENPSWFMENLNR